MKSELFQTIEVYNKAILDIKLRPGPVLPLVGQFEYTRTPWCQIRAAPVESP